MTVVTNQPEVFSKNIRFLRKRKKMSRAKFAKFIEINPLELYCIERGLTDSIYYKPLINLGEIYGISIDDIVAADLEEKYAGKRFHYSR